MTFTNDVNDSRICGILEPAVLKLAGIVREEGLPSLVFAYEDGTRVTILGIEELEVYATNELGVANWTRLNKAQKLTPDGRVQIIDPKATSATRFYKIQSTSPVEP